MIAIHSTYKKLMKYKLNIDSLLSDIRTELTNSIIFFPFIFLDKEKNEILKDKESSIKLDDILQEENLFLKKEIIKREMLGNILEKRNGFDIYLYPQINFTKEEKDKSTNIMVIGETGTGKSFWLHNLVNYIQNIQLEENNRYYLFDEKNLGDQYDKQHGEKLPNYLIVDKPYVYNIKPTNIYQNPIRIIDTPGYGDTRGLIQDNYKIQEIKKLLNKLNINSLNAICLFIKATVSRITMIKFIYPQLVSTFGKEIFNNLFVIFTFCDGNKNIYCLETLKNKDGDFYKCFGDINNIPYFTFNSMACFTDDREDVEKLYENNNINFCKFFKTVSSFKRVSLSNNNYQKIE